MTQKVCIIAGCSKRKLDYAAPAIDLNQGQLFKAIKKLAIKNNFDLKVLSGKYGLIDSDKVIEPYDQKIITEEDIFRICYSVHHKICKIWNEYDLIIIFMGKTYRKVLERFFDSKFVVIYDKRGIGGYLSLASSYNNLSKQEFLKEIEKFRLLECGNFLRDDLDFGLEEYFESDRPHNCFFCCYRILEDQCNFSKEYPEIYEKYLKEMRFIDSLIENERQIKQTSLMKFLEE